MLVILLLSLVFLITRLINLTLLPVFADEAIYIHWAQIIWHDANNRFIPLSDGKPPLFMWLLVPLLKVVSDPLFAGRLLSTLSGLATLVGVYFLSKKLFSNKVALLSGIFIIFQPFLLFYDRLAIVDSMLTAFGVWSFYLAFLLFERPSIGKGLLLGTLWGGAMLTKPTGAYYALLTPAFLLFYPCKKWVSKLKKLFIPALLASGYALGFYNILRLSGAFYMIAMRSVDYLRSKEELLRNPFQFIPGTSKVMFFWLVSYFSWVTVSGLIIFLTVALLKKEKKVGILFLWVIIPFLIQAAIGKIIYPRYLLMGVPFLLIILSWGINECLNFKNIKKTIYKKTLWRVLMIGVLINWLFFDFWLWTNPARAPLDIKEKEQYLFEWSAGFGIKEVANYLKKLPDDKEIIVATEGYFGTLPNGLQIYMDGINHIKIYGVGQPLVYLPDEVLMASQEGKETYLLINNTRLKIEDQSRLRLVGKYEKPEGPKGQESLLFFKVLKQNDN